MDHNRTSQRALDRLSDYSDESLHRELRRIANAIGKPSLTIGDIETHGRCSYATIKNRFGGLHSALKGAGLNAKDFNRNVSDDELLKELTRIWDLVLTREGRRIYKDDLVKYDSKYSQGPYYRRWGSWIKACEAALDWQPGPIARTIDGIVGSKRSTPRRKRPIPLRTRYQVLRDAGFKCQICGRSPSSTHGLELHVDHMKSEADGGTLDITNLRCCCGDCNLGKGSLTER